MYSHGGIVSWPGGIVMRVPFGGAGDVGPIVKSPGGIKPLLGGWLHCQSWGPMLTE